MSNWMIDESWARVDPQAAHDAGVEVVAGYESYDVSKNLTRANIDVYHAVGISVLLNWEATTAGALDPRNGPAHAARAVKETVGLGAPPGVVVVFSDDTDSHVDQVRPYYLAASGVMRGAGYLMGAYGGADVVQTLLAENIVDVAWVTNASSWSHGVPVTSAHIQQLTTHPIHIAGVSDSQFDVNQILRPIPGLWTPTGVSGDDFLMGLDQAHQDALFKNIGDIHDALFDPGKLGNPPRTRIEDIANLVGTLQALVSAHQSVAAGGTVDPTPIVNAVKASLAGLPHEVAVELHNALPAA